MNSEETPFTARADFPVKRMLRMLVLGNLMTTGSVYLLGVTALVVEGVISYFSYRNTLPNIEFVARSVAAGGGKLIKLVISYPGILFVLFALGGLASMIWYIIARRIETREMKKRWLIIQKSRKKTG